MTTQHDPAVMRYCVRSYLQDIRCRHLTARALEEEIMDLRYRLEGLSSPMAGVKGGNTSPSSKMALGLAALEQLESEWATMVANDAGVISDALMICRQTDERWACWLHWVSRLTWAQVAKTIGYSESHTKTDIVDAGIEQIYGDMPEEYRRYTIPNALA